MATAATVTYADPEPSGLASMLGGLIEANLWAHPDRARLLRPAIAVLEAPDAEVSVSVRLSPGSVTVANGDRTAHAHVRIVAGSGDLVALSAAPLRFGLPDVLRSEGRAVIGMLMRRRIRISGLLRHPVKLARLTKLLSVS